MNAICTNGIDCTAHETWADWDAHHNWEDYCAHAEREDLIEAYLATLDNPNKSQFSPLRDVLIVGIDE